MATLSVQVPETVALISKVQRAEGAKLPTYANWHPLASVRVLDLLCASTFGGGHSTAKITIETGHPGEQVDVERLRGTVAYGDRIAIGFDRGRRVDWQFCGYVVSCQLSIDGNAERIVWRLVGPEWWLGSNNAADGAGLVVRGQMRRKSAGDDEWQKAPATITKYTDWELFTDERAVFNPDGKKNMTRDDAILSPAKRTPQVKGKIWEMPDRRVKSIDVAWAWDMRQAAKLLIEQYGDLEFSGIASPDWENVPMSILDKMRETDVEGVGCYEALRRVLGNKYGFFVDPRPTDAKGKPADIKGSKWGPFRLQFFRRVDGPAASLYLNPRGTAMSRAKASVTRLEVAGDVSRSPNRVHVNASYVRRVKLIYWGGRTPALPDALKKTALQQGWNEDDPALADYAAPGKFEIDNAFTGVPKAKRDEWLNRYHSKGKDFAKYWWVFRRFAWNEANEWDTSKRSKYRTTFANWYAPDLLSIADTPEKPGVWYRRRRKLLDTLYLRNPAISQWEKHPPTLWMSAAPAHDSALWNDLKWRQISNSHFRFDSDRCALTFTVDDIAEWMPFDKQDSPETDEAKVWPDDPRTFATLLYSGVLRMCVECSVPVDFGMTCVAEPTGTAGAPFPREVWLSGQKDFINTLDYTGDGLAQVPSGLTVTPLDSRADAQRQADITRDSAQDEAIHASIMTAGDWQRQVIGSQIQTIAGRDINLAGAGGRGAQIVAVRLDMSTYKYEYLTESLALALKDRDRKLLEDKAQVYRNARRTTRIPNAQ